MKRFNVTGLCVPEEDYMADISGKIEKIKELVDNRCYFTINRARQYGKTTTLNELKKRLDNEYICVKISFEGLGNESFESAEAFCLTFMELVQHALQFISADDEYTEQWVDLGVNTFKLLSRHITKMCRNRKVVLMIDEVDKTSNNQVFLHFLSMLRDKFLARKEGSDYTFHSVILAGVYDIKNIKLKMISEGAYMPSAMEDKVYNSPWNIAADFEVDMSFNTVEIASMLTEYENEHNTGMDITAIAEEIHSYTSGYPFLVSRICKHIDEKLGKEWTANGVQATVKILLNEKNTLFDDIYKNLENNEKLYNLLYDITIVGVEYTFNIGNPEIALGVMYGLLVRRENSIAVSNRIFEIILSDYFISKNETSNHSTKIMGVLRKDVIENGRFDMELCLRKFAEHYAELFSERDTEFLERHGRLLFLSYLKPLINGHGFYHIESEFTDLRRMDIVVDYRREQFIIELKLWHGEKYKEDDESLMEIVDSLTVSKFNFKEEKVTMDDLNKANERLNKLTDRDVRIIYLPPATIAAAHYIGEGPEGPSSDMLHEFISNSNLIEIYPAARCYGFNHPNPGMREDGKYGYEFQVTIPDDMDVPAPLEKKRFDGGLYAAYMILMDEINGTGWNRLFEGWLKNHELWDSNISPSGENMNGLLEEHLDILHWRDKGHLAQVDLLLPIKRKEKQ